MSISLENCKDNDVPFWCFKGQYKGKCTKVYDGDTCHIIFKYKDDLVKIKARMLGYDAPELKSKDPDTKKHAIQARDKLRELILDKIVNCHFEEFDKYGRVLCNIYLDDNSLASGGSTDNSLASGGLKDNSLTSGGLKDNTHINEYMAKTYGIYGKAQYNEYD